MRALLLLTSLIFAACTTAQAGDGSGAPPKGSKTKPPDEAPKQPPKSEAPKKTPERGKDGPKDAPKAKDGSKTKDDAPKRDDKAGSRSSDDLAPPRGYR